MKVPRLRTLLIATVALAARYHDLVEGEVAPHSSSVHDDVDAQSHSALKARFRGERELDRLTHVLDARP